MNIKEFQQRYFTCIQFGKDNLRVEPAAKSQQRLAVYSHQYLYNHYEMLQEIYPLTEKYLGEENFRFFCKVYIEKYPMQKTDLHQYAESFGIFLQSRDELDEDFLQDFLALEWAVHAAYYHNGSCRVIHSEYPVYALYQHLKSDAPLADPLPQSVAVKCVDFKVLVELIE